MIASERIIEHLNNIAEILLAEEALVFDATKMTFKIKKNIDQLEEYINNINNDEGNLIAFKIHMNCEDDKFKNYKLCYSFDVYPNELYPCLSLFLQDSTIKSSEISKNVIVLYSNCILENDNDIYSVRELFLQFDKEKDFMEKYENNLFVVKNKDYEENCNYS